LRDCYCTALGIVAVEAATLRLSLAVPLVVHRESVSSGAPKTCLARVNRKREELRSHHEHLGRASIARTSGGITIRPEQVSWERVVLLW
jgi:mitochondrial fission protein ELM1